MEYRDRNRIFVHAGLPISPEEQSDGGFVAVMHLLLNNRSSIDRLWDEVRDILDYLRTLNEELNGKSPIIISWEDKVQFLDRDLIYALNLIFREIWSVALKPSESSHTYLCKEIIKTGWVMSTALDAILAGDCDNLDDWIYNEATMRGIDLDLGK